MITFQQNYTTYAEKSAAPVAAFVASWFKVALHTAPLCPSKVPIQSPVSPCRNMGFPSNQKKAFENFITHWFKIVQSNRNVGCFDNFQFLHEEFYPTHKWVLKLVLHFYTKSYRVSHNFVPEYSDKAISANERKHVSVLERHSSRCRKYVVYSMTLVIWRYDRYL